jgi:hypothetical protein
MAIDTKLPIASGSPVAVLSIIENDPSGFFNSIEFHGINKLILPGQHEWVFVSHISQVIKVDENGIG